ncbi:SLBB domain-containing protein [Chitinophaga sp. Cy-1792]|uniref:SLBB domain-containing protein n=1 Tax=Chitinophaga sp. Cy-1792 TaxID=2608339 RepID=UPI00142329A1|nr:SLBB domain-containing protein [Chitinophaga sp. Cy-1792]NIG52097.1 capsule biosynthesis protein [Chitinophaga sp. Cy-1792]
MFKNLLLIQLFLFCFFSIQAQVPSFSKDQVKQIKIDNLSDDQIRQIVAEMKKNKLTMQDIDKYAEQKGIPEEEVAKLKDRIIQLGLDKELDGNGNGENTDSSSRDTGGRKVDGSTDTLKFDQRDRRKTEYERAEEKKEERKRRIFGFDLFSNKNLTFEPNLRIPTPPNYKLATDDEVLIDVYGYSEVQHRLKVTPDGYIRIPNLGPVYVNGLTMEEAKARITKQLGSIYAGIRTGNTSVQITLGNIRTIRVTLIGEVERPGTYSVPSLATVANLLYVSGGPDENGSLRNIQVIRNGVSISTFDLYDFLKSGDLSNNIVLQDQDIVKVNPYKTRVELIGQVKHPAIFEAKDNEHLQDILDYAGGFTDIAYRDIIHAYRINNNEREVLNIPLASVSTLSLKSGDKFVVDSIISRFTNRISISGAVFRPGEYAVDEHMTVLDLINKAGGTKETVALSRGLIRRLQSDYTPAYLNFDVAAVLNGTQVIPVQREDSVIIFSKFDLREKYKVRIEGEVNNPGYFKYADSMHLEDLILIAGGFKDAASIKRIEISRRVRSDDYEPSNTERAIVMHFDVNEDLSSNSAARNFVLEPFDEVIIRKSPTYSTQGSVSVDGEVVYPGNYVISKSTERISDIIKRTGGLRADAYAAGAVMLRKTFVNKSDSTLLSNKLEVFYSKMQDTSDVKKIKTTVSKQEQLLGINLDQILKSPGSKYDLFLEEGDIIKVPKKVQTVQIFGEVYFPKKVRFDNGITFKDYIRGAGGFTGQSLKRRSYIVYSNGEVKNTKKVFFFNRYPKVQPGSEIYIPAKREKRGLSGQEAIAIGSGVASIALILVTLLDRVK